MAAVECPKCHRFTAIDFAESRFCGSCGAPLPRSRHRAEPDPQLNYPAARFAPYKPPKKKTELGAGGVAKVALVSLLYLLKQKRD